MTQPRRARLPPPGVLAGLVAVRRHRRRRAGRREAEPRPELMTRGIDRRRFAARQRWRSSPPRARRRRRTAATSPLDANVLRVPVRVRRDRLRSGAGRATSTRARVIAHIFEALLGYDPLALPVRLRAADGRGDARGLGRLPRLDGAPAARHLLRRRPGVQGPAARARRRRTTCTRSSASTTRRCKSPGYIALGEDGIVGLEELRGARAARQEAVRLRHASPRACARSTATRCSSSSPSRGRASRRRSPRARIARGGARGRRGLSATTSWRTRSAPGPIGSRRGGAARASCSRRNPGFRDVRYHERARAPTTPRARRWRAALQGPAPAAERRRRDRDRRGEPAALADASSTARPTSRASRPSSSPLAAPNGKLAPNLAKRASALQRYLNPDVAMSYFNMDDPVVGGYTPEKVALRRAISLAYDIDHEIRHHPARPGDRRRRRRCRRAPTASTRRCAATTAATTRRAPRRCSTSTATSTATATAGASSPTARRWC